MSVSLNKIVDVKVEVSSSVAITSDFDLGLIIGDTMMATNPGTVKVYDAETFMTEMVNDGYSTEDPEYIAALSYFAQSPKPSRVMIGTAIADPDGGVPDYVASLEAFKNADDRFYCVAFAYNPITDDNLQIMDTFFEAVEASSSPKVCFCNFESQFTTQTTDIATYLKDRGYTRLFAFNDSNGENIAIAFLGLISGLNSMQANSAYTAAYKTLAGVAAEDLTQAQLEFLVDNRANAYCKFGDRYSFTYPAVSCGGYHMDDLYFVDVAKFLIQQSVVGTLVSQRKIPQTESGMTTIINTIASACDRLGEIGFISGGIWKGDTVRSLKNGDALQNGYYIEAGSIAAQSAADRAARVTPTIYVALLSAGAIEHVIIRVFVTQ